MKTAVYIDYFPVGPLQCQCTIIADMTKKTAMVVDPGGDPEVILGKLSAKGLTLTKVIHTHAHFDHFLASSTLKVKTEAPLGLHKEDLFLWNMLELQCQMFGQTYIKTDQPDFFLKDQVDLSLSSECEAWGLHTPGHTPGSMSFYLPKAKILVSGDTLFRRGIGRTDLWGGDYGTIIKSIRERIFSLDNEVLVVPGHGETTYIGEEKEVFSF